MSMIDLTYVEGALAPRARADVVEQLTSALFGTLLHGPRPVGTTARRDLVRAVTEILRA